MEALPTPASYRTRATGRDLGETMPMWRVQTEGYRDEKGFLVGVVSPGAGMDDSPDAESIAAGLNTKGCDSVAIGRQGNFLHWGFAASPAYLTDEAKLVFVNALHYISRFAGQPPLVRKPTGVMVRSAVDDMIHGLSDEGFAQWTALIEESNRRLEAMQAKIRQREADGETLSDYDRQILHAGGASWSRGDAAKYVAPQALQDALGDDWAKYQAWYAENRPYLRSAGEGWRQSIDVDADAKALGIANHDPALLESCVTMLEAGDRPELARRLLRRYTLESFEDATGWRAWLDASRDRLFFTESGGYKFMVDTSRMPAGMPAADAASRRLQPAATTPANPVTFAAAAAPATVRAGGTATIVLKARMHPGWHVYSFVPAGKPYVATTVSLRLPDGLTAPGDWKRPKTKPSKLEPGVKQYDGTVVFEREIEVAPGASGSQEIVVVIDYQACDDRICLPPATVRVAVEIVIR